MSPQALAELKKKLRAEGFEIYRTREGYVELAERVRDNLILDSGIAVGWTSSADDSNQAAAEPAPLVRVTVRAQASHFPGYPPDAVAAQAENLALPFQELGYTAEQPRTLDLHDPSRPEHVLDRSHEVLLQKTLADVQELVPEIRALFALRRASSDE